VGAFVVEALTDNGWKEVLFAGHPKNANNNSVPFSVTGFLFLS